MIYKVLRIIILHPLLSRRYVLFTKGQIYGLVVLFIDVFEIDDMLLEIHEIRLSFFICACSQTFVVFHLPFISEGSLCFVPVLIVLNSEKANSFFALDFGDLDYGGDEFLQESVALNKIRPKMVNKVNDKTFYVRPIMILIGHDHQRAITKTFLIFILFSNLKA